MSRWPMDEVISNETENDEEELAIVLFVIRSFIRACRWCIECSKGAVIGFWYDESVRVDDAAGRLGELVSVWPLYAVRKWNKRS
jgi:hypothetical protein